MTESVFVSYAGPDRAWAEWAAWHLRDAGHHVELDVWDWRTGDNFIERMTDAMQRATVVVALFSNHYFHRTRWTHQEWTSVMGDRGRLIPLTIEPLADTDIPDILAAVIRKDLHGLDEPAAIAALLAAVNGPTGPGAPPVFPGGAHAPAPAGTSHAGSPDRRPRMPAVAGQPRVWSVPSRNLHFTGRENLIAEMREELLGSQRAVVQALRGLGGIGKTQVALEYAHRFASQYDIVWWIDAEQTDQIHIQYTELATRLGIASSNGGAERNTRTLLEHLRTQDRWLIILDNADDPGDFETLLPAGPGHVLITSRNPEWRNVVRSHDLDVFPRADSLAYFSARIPGIDPEHADALANDLGDLPLALAQAAGVITSGVPPIRYRRLLADKTAKLMAKGIPPGYPTPLAATVDIAISRLTADHPGAVALLRIAAFLGPDPIPTSWLEAVGDQLSTLTVDTEDVLWPWSALQPLNRYGLARVDHETFQIHRLTQAIVRDHATPADATAAQDDATNLLAAVNPGNPVTPAAWPEWAALTSHLTAHPPITMHRPPLRQAFLKAARYLVHSGQARAARDLTINVHSTWTAISGADHPDTLAVAETLGHAAVDFGKHSEGRRVNEETFEKRRQVLGEDHPDTLNSANNLASTLNSLGEHAEARRMHTDTLARRRRILGEDHPDTLISANNLAHTLNGLGEHTEARRMHTDTLARRRRILGEDHPDTLTSANNLASTLDSLGEHTEARRMHTDTLARRRRVLGEDHPDTLTSANNLASTLDSLGEHAEARRMHTDTLARRRRVLGEDHPETLQSANNLAYTLNSLGEHTEARRMHTDTLERRHRVLGEDHPDTLNSANNVASTLGRLGEYTEARRMHTDTLARRRRVLGENHPDTLTSANNLASTLGSLGEHTEARRMHTDTLERRRRILGEDHPSTLTSASNLAYTLNSLGEHAEAVRLLKETRTRSRQTLGDDHEFTQRVTASLATALTAAGKRHEAQKLLASRKAGQRRTRRKSR
ncbi:tetratricopeptide repeat protein [Streptomyces puniciscabiei]|uniref:Tetratricopeptide repeat protein n=3 Tax=Streptomyces puniciscabiei TaxID=164348 RepID=A0A542UIS6_9ACTN|nr:FxSxx-COOH system tetratricopeptide repeat protein [Streptomyces puniciscabiei]TQK98963.1 tetratricopeptide repeat protein [Streptomyces puniciscabiei]